MASPDKGKLTRIITFLKTVDLFSGLNEDTLKYLAENSTETSYSKCDIICKKNLFAHTVYFIRSGTVTEFAVDKNDFSCIAKTRKKPDYFGELGVLLQESFTTTVVASSACMIVSIPAEPFCKVVWENPGCIMAILRAYRERLQNSAEKHISCTLFNAEGRLAYSLLLLHSSEAENKYVTITQEDLSQYCGIARQTASRILSEWKQQKIIDTYRGKIAVFDPDALADILLNSANSR